MVTLNGLYSLRANAPSLSLSPPYLYSCKVAPRPPYFIDKVFNNVNSLNSLPNA